MQYPISFRYASWWLNIYIHYERITTISLVTVCHHKKLLKYYWLYPYAAYYIHMIYLFYNWKEIPVSPLTYFTLVPSPNSVM